MKTYNILFFCINQPLHYAIYDDDVLVSAHTIYEKPSSALAIAFQEIEAFCQNKRENERAKIGAIYYAAGPGNLSALRLTHVFLHSLAIIKGIKLYAADSFALLPNSYIYAFGKRYFHKADSSLDSMDSVPESNLTDSSARESKKLESKSADSHAQEFKNADSANCKDFSDSPKPRTPKSKNEESADSLKPHTKALSLDATHGISCVLLDTPPKIAPFIAPQILPKERFTLPCEPLYILPPL